MIIWSPTTKKQPWLSVVSLFNFFFFYRSKIIKVDVSVYVQIFICLLCLRPSPVQYMSSKVNCFKSLLVEVSDYSSWSTNSFVCFVRRFFFLFLNHLGFLYIFFLCRFRDFVKQNVSSGYEQRIISSSRYSLCSQLICCRRPDRTAQPSHC